MARQGNNNIRQPSESMNDGADKIIVEKIRQGDQEAFERLYFRYFKPLLGFMLRVTHSRENAEDISQEVFTRLWNMRGTLDPDRNIKALIFVLARRAAIDLYRRNEKSAVVYTDENQDDTRSDAAPSPEDILQNVETKLLLDIAIEKMPKKQREIFKLHYNDNLDADEIAGRLGLSYENVRKQIYNGKKQLRDVIALILVSLSFIQ